MRSCEAFDVLAPNSRRSGKGDNAGKEKPSALSKARFSLVVGMKPLADGHYGSLMMGDTGGNPIHGREPGGGDNRMSFGTGQNDNSGLSPAVTRLSSLSVKAMAVGDSAI